MGGGQSPRFVPQDTGFQRAPAQIKDLMPKRNAGVSVLLLGFNLVILREGTKRCFKFCRCPYLEYSRANSYPWIPFPPRRARPGPGPHKSQALSQPIGAHQPGDPQRRHQALLQVLQVSRTLGQALSQSVGAQRDWYFIAEQPAPAPHLTHSEGCIGAYQFGDHGLFPVPKLKYFICVY